MIYTCQTRNLLKARRLSTGILSNVTDSVEIPKASPAEIWAEALSNPRFKEKFFSKITVRPDGCWQWSASRRRSDFYGGFGVFVEGRQYVLRAHRISYELCYGPIPKGAQIDHICENKACVNPAHLEAVSCKTNLIRSRECRDLAAKPSRKKAIHGNNYPIGLRANCRRGHHGDCLASKCSCECHMRGLK